MARLRFGRVGLPSQSIEGAWCNSVVSLAPCRADRAYASTSTTASHSDVAATTVSATSLPASYTEPLRTWWQRVQLQAGNISAAVASALLPQQQLPALPVTVAAVTIPTAATTPANVCEGPVVERLHLAEGTLDFAAINQQLTQAIKAHKPVDCTDANLLIELLAEAIAQGSIDAEVKWAVLGSVGFLRHRPPARVARLLMEALRYEPAAAQLPSAAQSAVILSVMAAFHHTDARLLRDATQAISKDVASLRPDALAGVLADCGTLHYRDRRLTDVLVGALLWHVGTLSPLALANAACGLAAIRHKDAMTDVVLDSIAEAALRSIDSFHPNELARMCHAFARLGHWGPSNQRVMDAMQCQMLRKHQLLSQQGVVDTVLANAKTDTESSDVVTLMDVLCSDVKQNLGQYSTAQLVDLLWGLSKLRYADKALYLLAGREIMLDIPELHACHLADLLFSCAAVNCTPSDKLLHVITARAMQLLHSMTTRELTNTLWALAILDRLTPVHWQTICQWLSKHALEDLQPQHLQRAFQAYLLAETLQRSLPAGNKLQLPSHLQGAAERSWRDAVYFQQQRCGHLQSEVVSSLMALKLPYELGVLLDDGMFMIDLTLDVPLPGEGVVQRVGIAIDQGHHFTCNKPYAPLANTIFSRRFLAARGLRMVHIEKHRWRELQTSTARTTYLKRLLDASVKQT